MFLIVRIDLYLLAIFLVSGTTIPRNLSPSPYSPFPVLKKVGRKSRFCGLTYVLNSFLNFTNDIYLKILIRYSVSIILLLVNAAKLKLLFDSKTFL